MYHAPLCNINDIRHGKVFQVEGVCAEVLRLMCPLHVEVD